MMSWAAEAGLDVPAVDLLPAASVPALFDERDPGSTADLVARFDRTPDGSPRAHPGPGIGVDTLPDLRFTGATTAASVCSSAR